MRRLSKQVKCKIHNLTLRIPQEDSEYVELTTDVSELFSHLKKFPGCKFEGDDK